MFLFFFFFFNDTATTEIYTLSLQTLFRSPQLEAVMDEMNRDGRRILLPLLGAAALVLLIACGNVAALLLVRDRKSTRLNSSHGYISYAVFCLKKKKSNYRSTRLSKYDEMT